MGRFMMLYKGDATDPADMSEDERNVVMAKWAEWMQGVGPALADVGAPLGPGTSLIDDGSTDRTPGILREWADRDPRIRAVTQVSQMASSASPASASAAGSTSSSL